FYLHQGESTFISPGVKHRLSNPGKFALEIIEVQLGEYVGEDDIIRFKDEYGRN
ncbi:MAG: mannose-1-phosphate guanylyltransferase/mannose-6-phosphate isomerase, partial [ANME-2 cluster archaeon]